jgi:hypothetical protein
MPRLYLFAEGTTEQTFADTVLTPHLAGFGVYLHRPVTIADARKKGRIHRGGGRRYLPIKNDIGRFLSQEKGADVYFTTMIDLYAIAADFPEMAEADKLRHLPVNRVEVLEQAFAADIRDRRFIPYIQLHEFEAYLFSDPSAFELLYDDQQKATAALQAIADSHDTPELIDDGQHSAPSKRIISHFPDYEHTKSSVGPLVAELIGLEVIRDKCPHFAGWLTRLESLGSSLQPPAETSND